MAAFGWPNGKQALISSQAFLEAEKLCLCPLQMASYLTKKSEFCA